MVIHEYPKCVQVGVKNTVKIAQLVDINILEHYAF